MGLALNEVSLTTRRTAGRVNVYPRLLRDGAMLPRIDLAITYFESLLGHERQELEPAMLVELFGDVRLARGLAAALGATYRFRPRRIEEVIGRTGAGRLRRAALASAPALRLWLYDRLNAGHHGFLGSPARLEVWPQLETALRLRPGQLDQLLYLDRPEHLRLERVGARPRPVDVAAHYNVLVLECLLRHSQRVELGLVRPLAPLEAAAIEQLCRAQAVDFELDVGAGRLRLLGRQDALGGWGRHGRHLARAALGLLERGRDLLSEGEARLEVRGRVGTLRLSSDVLDLLGGPPALAAGWESAELAELVQASAGALRGGGWRVRGQPEAVVCAAGTVLPDLLVQPAAETAGVLLVAVRGPGHARRLAGVARVAASGERLAFVGYETDIGELRAAGAQVLGLPAGGLPTRAGLARWLCDELGADVARAA